MIGDNNFVSETVQQLHCLYTDTCIVVVGKLVTKQKNAKRVRSFVSVFAMPTEQSCPWQLWNGSANSEPGSPFKEWGNQVVCNQEIVNGRHQRGHPHRAREVGDQACASRHPSRIIELL